MRSWAHRAELTAYARRLLGFGADGAEDVVQEAYARLSLLEAEDRMPDDVRAWLFRVVRNLVVDERRRRDRESRAVAQAGGTYARVGQGSTGAAELFEQRERAHLVLHELASLPPAERRAVELDQAGLAAPLIAHATGTTTNAVHQALFRARRRLRRAGSAVLSFLPFPLVRILADGGEGPASVAIAGGGSGMRGGRLLPLAVSALVAGVAGTGVVVREPSRHPAAAGLAHHVAGRSAEPAARTALRSAAVVTLAAQATPTMEKRRPTAGHAGLVEIAHAGVVHRRHRPRFVTAPQAPRPSLVTRATPPGPPASAPSASPELEPVRAEPQAPPSSSPRSERSRWGPSTAAGETVDGGSVPQDQRQNAGNPSHEDVQVTMEADGHASDQAAPGTADGDQGQRGTPPDQGVPSAPPGDPQPAR